MKDKTEHDIVAKHSIDQLDFIKIDVEGFETKVIAGLKNTIRTYRPIIFMEWDKKITKQQFEEYNLFNTLFNDYIIKAVTRNPKEKVLTKKIWQTCRDIFNKKNSKKRKIIGEFNKALDYRHIVFIPREKGDILNAI